MEEQTEKKNNWPNIILAIIATVVIIVLGYFYYYYSIKEPPGVVQNDLPIQEVIPPKEEVPEVQPTNVVKFIVPDDLVDVTVKSGECSLASVAQPYRQDAFKCKVANVLYDPCFATENKEEVFCDINPLNSDPFLIKLTKPLPVIKAKEANENWAWFIELRDGTYCGPYTGTKPSLKDKVIHYGCKSDTKGEYIALIGELVKGEVWTTEKAFLVKDGLNWSIKSSEVMEIQTVWQ